MAPTGVALFQPDIAILKRGHPGGSSRCRLPAGAPKPNNICGSMACRRAFTARLCAAIASSSPLVRQQVCARRRQ
jgi:hypothetical protein